LKKQPPKDKSAPFLPKYHVANALKKPSEKVLALSVVAVTMAIPYLNGDASCLANSGVSAACNARSCPARGANIELGTKVIPELDDR
jgi:hypothetical protein